ncbi:MAG: iron-sulfur cluster assembly scaffold protein [Desulfobulbaceae bacterium]|nr:MAG: iron-sulfur cluster assembly scaffold protein [Desulfobulbaceae bacterium]
MSILAAFFVIFLLAFCWFGLHYLNDKQLKDPDGNAKITGNCGDTMEISLQFSDGRITDTYAWTNGCSFSQSCVQAATQLAQGKGIEEAQKISMLTIMEEVGRLPETHLHCAQLAETTLQRAITNYLSKQTLSANSGTS